MWGTEVGVPWASAVAGCDSVFDCDITNLEPCCLCGPLRWAAATALNTSRLLELFGTLGMVGVAGGWPWPHPSCGRTHPTVTICVIQHEKTSVQIHHIFGVNCTAKMRQKSHSKTDVLNTPYIWWSKCTAKMRQIYITDVDLHLQMLLGIVWKIHCCINPCQACQLRIALITCMILHFCANPAAACLHTGTDPLPLRQSIASMRNPCPSRRCQLCCACMHHCEGIHCQPRFSPLPFALPAKSTSTTDGQVRIS